MSGSRCDYGINDVRATSSGAWSLKDSNRWGLLGKGGVLMATAYPNRTAPVLRGAWILEQGHRHAAGGAAAGRAFAEGEQDRREGRTRCAS